MAETVCWLDEIQVVVLPWIDHVDDRLEGAITGMSDIICLEGVTIDLNRESITAANGEPIALRAQSFAVLRQLLEKSGRVVTKEELIQAVWPQTAVTDDSLVQCIGDIRKALGADGARALRTVPRRGYILDLPPMPVEAVDQALLPSPPAVQGHRSLVHSLRVALGSPSFWTFGRSSDVAKRVSAGLAAIVVIITLAVLNVTAQSSSSPRSGPAKLAVIPLAGIGGDPSLRYFAAGTTENLVTQLSRSPELRLVEAPALQDEDPQSPAEIGKAAGADYVLFGSVQKSDTTMRILAHLVDVSNGEHLWANRFDRTAKDPFKLQDEVTSETLRVIAGEDGLIRKRLYEDAWGQDTGALKEYDYFLRGHDLFMRFTEADNQEAMRIWTEGLERFPDSGILAVKAGYAYFMRLQLGWTKDRSVDLASAFALGRRGLSAPRQMPLSQTLGHMLMAELNFYDHDFEEAMKERAFVLELAPYDFFHRANLAYVAVGSGYPEQAVAALEGITPHHPLADFGYAALAWARFAMKDYPAAIKAAGAAIHPVPVYAYAFEAASLSELGQIGRAKAALAKLVAADPSVSLSLIRELHPNADGEVLDREVEALRRLGLS